MPALLLADGSVKWARLLQTVDTGDTGWGTHEADVSGCFR